MSELMNKYIAKKKIEMSDTARKARNLKFCYFFLKDDFTKKHQV